MKKTRTNSPISAGTRYVNWKFEPEFALRFAERGGSAFFEDPFDSRKMSIATIGWRDGQKICFTYVIDVSKYARDGRVLREAAAIRRRNPYDLSDTEVIGLAALRVYGAVRLVAEYNRLLNPRDLVRLGLGVVEDEARLWAWLSEMQFL